MNEHDVCVFQEQLFCQVSDNSACLQGERRLSVVIFKGGEEVNDCVNQLEEGEEEGNYRLVLSFLSCEWNLLPYFVSLLTVTTGEFHHHEH